MISRLSLFTKLSSYRTTRLVNLTSNITGCSCQKTASVHFSRRIGETFTTDSNTSPSETPPKKKKTVIIPKITLLQGNDISVTTLEEAQKISKRRSLKLVKIVDLDTKSERPIYKLMTPQEYHAEDLKQREQKRKERDNKFIKGEKLLMLNQNISEHDLETQCRKIIKWIEKSYEVRVVVNGDANNISIAEKVCSGIEKRVSDTGRIIQKRQKGSDMKFQILPLKKSEKDSKDSGGVSGNND